MQKQIIVTGDGSHTISIGEGITYHSIHGTIQESMHVYINAGLLHLYQTHETLTILEVGLGTGLNALLTTIASTANNLTIHYTALEPFPLTPMETNMLNYILLLPEKEVHTWFYGIHNSEWEKDIDIAPNFKLHKNKQSLIRFSSAQLFHLIYFDAFAPAVQPELWTTAIFQRLYSMMHPGGILTTYCSKGNVRRAMQSAGFSIEKLSGPEGKREILRGRK